MLIQRENKNRAPHYGALLSVSNAMSLCYHLYIKALSIIQIQHEREVPK